MTTDPHSGFADDSCGRAHWVWHDPTIRTDQGLRTTSTSATFRVTFQGHLRAPIVSARLQDHVTYVRIRRTWWAELPIETAGALARVLARDHGRPKLAALLVAVAPHWTAANATPVEPPTPAEPALVIRARALLTDHVFRLGDPELRATPDYYDTALPILVSLLAGGFRPGDPEAVVEVDGVRYGRWKLQGQEVAVLGASGGPPITTPVRDLLTFTRDLERRHGNLPLALSLRLAFLVGSRALDGATEGEDSQKRRALGALSRATCLDDIQDSGLRAYVGALIERIPFPTGCVPRPYQEVGIAFAALSGYRCLIGDSPGVGKTAVAMGALNLAPSQLLPALVVAPKSVTRKWVRELEKWAPWFRPFLIETGRDQLPPPGARRVYVVSWDLMKAYVEDFLIMGIQCVIWDESHNAKHVKAQRTKAFLDISRAIPHIIELSGTAMENRPVELFTQLHALDSTAFPTRKAFAERYANLHQRQVMISRPDGGSYTRTFVDDSGADNLDELASRLQGYMIRRLKSEVLRDLPPKTRIDLWTPLPPRARRVYDRVRDEFYSWLCAQSHAKGVRKAAREFVRLVREDGAPQGQAMDEVLRGARNALPPEALAQMALVRMGHLRRVVAEAKVPAALQWTADFLAARDDDSPLVISCEHQVTLKGLGRGLSRLRLPSGEPIRWTWVDGSVTGAHRDKRIEAFQHGALDVLIGSKAIREGIDLYRGSNMLFVERWLVPAHEEQMEDRQCRMGQHNPVFIHRLMAPDTVDEDIAALVDAKREVVEEVMGGETVATRERRGHTKGKVVESFAAALLRRVSAQMDRQNTEVTQQDVVRLLQGGS